MHTRLILLVCLIERWVIFNAETHIENFKWLVSTNFYQYLDSAKKIFLLFSTVVSWISSIFLITKIFNIFLLTILEKIESILLSFLQGKYKIVMI